MKSLLELCHECAKRHDLHIDVADQYLVFGRRKNEGRKRIGQFDTVHGMYCFLYGYDAAKEGELCKK